MRLRLLLAAGTAAALAAGTAVSIGVSDVAHGSVTSTTAIALQGIHKIKHVIVIMQENRSFDSYFGTFPGAVGIPPGVCVPDPLHGGCVKPFVDQMGDKMDYSIALDNVPAGGNPNEGSMAKTWMKAAEENGIPAAFVIRDGKIA